jgi:glycerophosphoryl diester phosphodiesterase
VCADRVLVAAHRGASLDAPENTLPAFREALRCGADLVELDCRPCADGSWIVLHDATVDRTTDARRVTGKRQIRLDRLSIEEAQAFDAGSWLNTKWRGVRIPTLEEACRFIAPQAVVLIERKDGSAASLIEFLEQADLLSRVVVQAFDWAFLSACRELCPDVVLFGLGAGDLTDAHLAQAQAMGLVGVNWSAATLGPTRIEAAHEQGLRVWAWTVDHPNFARELIGHGLDGLVTNAPGPLRDIVRQTPRRTTTRATPS